MNPRFQEMKSRMEGDMSKNREAAEKTVRTIKEKMQEIDERMDVLIEEKQVLAAMLSRFQGYLERLN